MAVRVHKARDERRDAKVADLLVRVPIAQLVEGAHGADTSVLHHNGAVLDRAAHDGQNVAGS